MKNTEDLKRQMRNILGMYPNGMNLDRITDLELKKEAKKDARTYNFLKTCVYYLENKHCSERFLLEQKEVMILKIMTRKQFLLSDLITSSPDSYKSNDVKEVKSEVKKLEFHLKVVKYLLDERN